MHLIQRTYSQSPARSFALVVMLCALVLQVQEAGHDHSHGHDDSPSLCLVYKAETALLHSSLPVETVVGNGSVDRAQPTLATRMPFSASFLPRGPPSHA